MMVLFSKILTILLLPPGCIILGMLFIALIVPRRGITLAFLAALLYLLSIEPAANFLLRPLEDRYPPLGAEFPLNAAEGDRPDALVALGGGTVQGSAEAGPGRDTLSSDAMKRAVYAFTLRDRFSGPLVYSGGNVFNYGQETEAAVAARFFASLGLSPDRLVSEGQSRNTWENARETAKLGFHQVILVTSAYHLPRSVFCFERNGLSVIPAPTDYKINRGRAYDGLSFMPQMGYLYGSYLALHEYLGLLYYRIAYR